MTRIRWTSDNANYLTPAFAFKSERVSEIEELEGDECRYRTWIAFGGFTAGRYKKKYGDAFQRLVMEFCRDLKERSEKTYTQDGVVLNDAERNEDIGEVSGTV